MTSTFPKPRVSSLPRVALGFDDELDEVEFAEDGAGHDEGIEVGLAHAAGEFVEGGDEFGPGVEEGVNAG